MSNEITDSAQAYQRLLNINYRIILGRKGKLTELNVIFEPENFYHLTGLHKLLNLDYVRLGREKIFREILNGEAPYEKITLSKGYDDIKERLTAFKNLEEIFDSNEIVFRYNEKMNNYSKIKAEYLMSTPINNKEMYVFLDKTDGCGDDYFCRSFFPKDSIDYTKNQSKMALLYKEKIDLRAGSKVVQFDKLTPKAE